MSFMLQESKTCCKNLKKMPCYGLNYKLKLRLKLKKGDKVKICALNPERQNGEDYVELVVVIDLLLSTTKFYFSFVFLSSEMVEFLQVFV